MTPNEIAFVKNFLDKKSLSATFVNQYNSHHWEYNPQSIEEFFILVDPKKVLSQAFFFTPNSRYGVEFWLRVQNELNAYLDAKTKNVGEWEWVIMKAQFKLLRYNWDFGVWTRKESSEEARKRMQEMWVKFKKGEFKPIPSTRLADLLKPNEAPEVDEQDEEDKIEDPLAAMGFSEVYTSNMPGMRLKENQASINTRKGSKKITFNATDTKIINDTLGDCYAKMMRNKQGEIVLVMNNNGEGVPASYVKGKTPKSMGNVVVNSADLVTKIRTFLNIKEEYAVLKVEEIAKTETYIGYQLSTNR